jgi:hypothetical protein
MSIIKRFFKNIIPSNKEVKLDTKPVQNSQEENLKAEPEIHDVEEVIPELAKIESSKVEEVKKKPGRPKGSSAKKTPSKKTPSKKKD